MIKKRFCMTSGARRLAFVAGAIALLMIVFGKLHYDSINRSEDPRMLSARQGLEQYNEAVGQQNYEEALAILDQVERVYTRVPGYADSFERGVIHNNRGSVYLLQAEAMLIEKGTADVGVLALLGTARSHLQKSVVCYETWTETWAELGPATIRDRLLPFFPSSDPAFGELGPERFLDKRIEDVQLAQIETPRRLSVSLTNLGIVCRYAGEGDDARNHYERALSLWPQNHAAEDNLNVLLGRPVIKRSPVRKIFPEQRTP